MDPATWVAAGWSGAAFLHDPEGEEPPCLGFLFDDIEAGARIFSAWLNYLGSADEFEELRVAIIEGPIHGEGRGYSVNFSYDPLGLERRAAKKGERFELATTVILSRILRVATNGRSANLERFKKEFARHGKYSLVPCALDSLPRFDCAIPKVEIHFRKVLEITSRDQDAVVFPANYFGRDKTIQ